MNLNAYITFAGNCEEALELYKSVLGGEIGEKMLYDGSPMETPENKGKILHTSFTFDGNMFMAADMVGESLEEGNNISLSIGLNDLAESERIFNELSVGGAVTMPFQQTFWAKGFGMFTDRFGINWMVNCD